MTTSQNPIQRRLPAWLAPALICLAVAILYAPTLTTPFIFDDMGSIPDNKSIRSLTNWRAILSPPAQETVAGRPVVNATLALNYAIDGTNVRGYHALNIAIFMASCLTLWAILRTTASAVLAQRSPDRDKPTIDNTAAWFASAVVLVWAVHPLQTETIAYIIQRTELLKTLFYLLTLHASMRWMSTRRPAWLVWAAVSCALGMGCKESMVSAPLMVLVYDYLFVAKSWRGAITRHRALYACLALSWFVLLGVTLGAPRSMSVGFHLGVSAMEYLQTQAHVLVHYLRLCFWPHPLAIVYDWPIEHNFAHAIPPGLIVVALLAFTVWLLVKRHWLAAPWAMFFLVLGPTSSFIPIVSEVAAERRMHLPMLAVVLSVAALLEFLASKRAASPESPMPLALCVALAIVSAVPLAFVTADRLTEYRDNLTLWLAAVRDMPHSQGAEQNLGVAYKKLDRMDEAIVHFKRAITLNPQFALPYGSLASIYHDRGEFTRAAADYEAGLRCDPNYRFALQNLAVIYLDQGQPDRAKPLIDRMLSLAPNTAGVHNSLGLYFAQKGQFPAAIAAFKDELKIDPASFDALHNLGMSLIDAGRPGEAMAVFESFLKKAQGLDPSLTPAAARKHVSDLLPEVQGALVHLRTHK